MAHHQELLNCNYKLLVLHTFVVTSRCHGSAMTAAGCQAGRPDHDQQHCYHHTPTVKPQAATAVVELLIIGVRTPETC
jgi:hypothetical protein